MELTFRSCGYLGGSRFLDLEKAVSVVGFWSRKSAKRETEDSNKRHPHSGSGYFRIRCSLAFETRQS